MYDAVTAKNMPLTGQFYLYYVDGIYANEAAVKAHAPGKRYVPCTIGHTAAAKGMILDVETGDATPADAKVWCENYPGSNTDLTIYCNSSTWASVKAALAGLSTQPNYIVAEYDGIGVIPAGAIGKQYKTGAYDTSVIAAYWPGVDPAPSTTPAKTTPPVTTTQPGYSGAPKLPDWTLYQAQIDTLPDWEKIQFILALIPTGVYEGYTTSGGYDNNNVFGIYYGENFVSWCVIFDWYVYAIAKLTAIVPKTDNVSSFMATAQSKGQWSQYPSLGAWVNFDDGGHTETVIGFDGVNVYTKGGNTIPTGATDNGVGYGVYSHSSVRTATRIVGYFAPKYPDGHCPPTADPKDYRGGKAVTQYTYKLPAITPPKTTAPPVETQPKNTPIAEDTDMVIVTYPRGTGWKGDFLLSGGVLTHIPTPAAEAALKALGVGTKALTTANFNALYAAFGGK